MEEKFTFNTEYHLELKNKRGKMECTLKICVISSFTTMRMYLINNKTLIFNVILNIKSDISLVPCREIYVYRSK